MTNGTTTRSDFNRKRDILAAAAVEIAGERYGCHMRRMIDR